MELQKLDGFNENSKDMNLLDMTKLIEGTTGKAVAFCSNHTNGSAKSGNGFITFYLKDKNANIVTARLFDVQAYFMSGLASAKLKGRLVNIEYKVQYFNGLSLILLGSSAISLCTEVYPLERFIGKVHFDNTEIERIGKRIYGEEFKIPAEYGLESFSRIAQGRVGAFNKAFDMTILSLIQFIGFEGIDLNEMFNVAFKTFEHLFSLLKLMERYDKLAEIGIEDKLMSVNFSLQNEPNRAIIMDTIRACLGKDKPKHIYAHLISRSYFDALTKMEMILVNNSLILNSDGYVGGERILRY